MIIYSDLIISFYLGRDIHLVSRTTADDRGYQVVEAVPPSQSPPLWIGFTGNHYQSLEIVNNERKCETVKEANDVEEAESISDMEKQGTEMIVENRNDHEESGDVSTERTISVDDVCQEMTLSCDSMDDVWFSPPAALEQPQRVNRGAPVVVTGADSDTSMIVSLPSQSFGSDWSRGDHETSGSDVTVEEGLNKARINTLRDTDLRACLSSGLWGVSEDSGDITEDARDGGADARDGSDEDRGGGGGGGNDRGGGDGGAGDRGGGAGDRGGGAGDRGGGAGDRGGGDGDRGGGDGDRGGGDGERRGGAGDRGGGDGDRRGGAGDRGGGDGGDGGRGDRGGGDGGGGVKGGGGGGGDGGARDRGGGGGHRGGGDGGGGDRGGGDDGEGDREGRDGGKEDRGRRGGRGGGAEDRVGGAEERGGGAEDGGGMGKNRGRKRKNDNPDSLPPKKKKVAKCRATHGKEHRDLWCKECRQSKKCTKYI